MPTVPPLVLTSGETALAFQGVAMHWKATGITNVFGLKNNKTLQETVAHRRYAGLAPIVHRTYAANLTLPLGTFLLGLKETGDPFYQRFLNRYGDEAYCSFAIDHPVVATAKGLYAYAVQGAVTYIGRCLDSFNKRINQGYGRIHPKNCYLDGQATNCHLNSLIARHGQNVSFHVCPLEDAEAIKRDERALIAQYQPEWNIALK